MAGSSVNGSLGCFDADQDSWADVNDSFPLDMTQWNDTDNDGYGDNPLGTNPDSCPTIAGNSSTDQLGCLDSDYDSWSDSGDAFPPMMLLNGLTMTLMGSEIISMIVQHLLDFLLMEALAASMMTAILGQTTMISYLQTQVNGLIQMVMD